MSSNQGEDHSKGSPSSAQNNTDCSEDLVCLSVANFEKAEAKMSILEQSVIPQAESIAKF